MKKVVSHADYIRWGLSIVIIIGCFLSPNWWGWVPLLLISVIICSEVQTFHMRIFKNIRKEE